MQILKYVNLKGPNIAVLNLLGSNIEIFDPDRFEPFEPKPEKSNHSRSEPDMLELFKNHFHGQIFRFGPKTFLFMWTRHSVPEKSKMIDEDSTYNVTLL